MNKPLRWYRKLWAIELSSLGWEPMIIGAAWSGAITSERYPGEPTRALEFTTRHAARAWCTEQQAIYRGRQDYCADWRFRPVRVEEIVRKIGR